MLRDRCFLFGGRAGCTFYLKKWKKFFRFFLGSLLIIYSLEKRKSEQRESEPCTGGNYSHNFSKKKREKKTPSHMKLENSEMCEETKGTLKG